MAVGFRNEPRLPTRTSQGCARQVDLYSDLEEGVTLGCTALEIDHDSHEIRLSRTALFWENQVMRSVAFVLLATLLSAPVFAQTSIPVQFERGADSATLSGSIIGDEYVDYVLGARGGQMMNVGLSVDGSNGSGAVFFNVLPPGSDGVAIYNSSIDGNDAFIELPQNGDYTIRVYHMGNDRDAGRTSGFVVGVGIK